MKTSAIVGISVVIIIIAVAGVFLMYTMNPLIQSNPTQVSNYSAAINSIKPQINSIKDNITSLNSLKPQIDSINNNITALNSVKNDITAINGKLSSLESKLNQSQSVQTMLTIMLDKSVYVPGQTIHISVYGVDPQRPVQIQLVDNTGFLKLQNVVYSDSVGKVTNDFPVPSDIAPGSFQVKIISGEQMTYQPILIVSNAPTSYPLTAQTSRPAYKSGDLIEVIGTGIPNSTITSVLTSPSGRTFTSQTTVQGDSTYSIFYSDSQPYETGSWYFTIYDNGQTRTTYFTIGPNPSITPISFTAQSDKTVYLIGNIIEISGTAQPFTSVSGVLTSPSGFTYTSSAIVSDTGSYQISYPTQSGYETGTWLITLTNQGQNRQVSLFLESSSQSVTGDFTSQTDKTIYKKGDQIQISGTGEPFTRVSSVLASPSGITYDGAAMTNFDGSYDITYSTLQSFENGNWHITLYNNGQVSVDSIFLEQP